METAIVLRDYMLQGGVAEKYHTCHHQTLPRAAAYLRTRRYVILIFYAPGNLRRLVGRSTISNFQPTTTYSPAFVTLRSLNYLTVTCVPKEWRR